MIKFITDEDFDARILRGVLRKLPHLDIVRVQDVGLRSASDREVLEFAALENRVLLTHDVSTMSAHAYERVTKGLAMAGVFEISQSLPIGQVIEEVCLIAELSLDNEWQDQVRFLPLQ